MLMYLLVFTTDVTYILICISSYINGDQLAVYDGVFRHHIVSNGVGRSNCCLVGIDNCHLISP